MIVTGKGGVIARRLLGRLSGKFETVATSSDGKGPHTLDLRAPEMFDYGVVRKGDFVIHLASISSPDRCEKEYDEACRVNVDGTAYFIRRCLENGARVLFMSSDAVYGAGSEKGGSFDENSEPEPYGSYGRMKLLVEKKFAGESGFKAFRLSYVFSRDDKFIKYLKECSEKNAVAEIYRPFCRNVVYIGDVLDAIEAMIGRWGEFGAKAFNICGDMPVSRKEMAGIYSELVDGNLRMREVAAPEAFLLARPSEINVKSIYIYELLGRKPTPIREAFAAEFGL